MVDNNIAAIDQGSMILSHRPSLRYGTSAKCSQLLLERNGRDTACSTAPGMARQEWAHVSADSTASLSILLAASCARAQRRRDARLVITHMAISARWALIFDARRTRSSTPILHFADG